MLKTSIDFTLSDGHGLGESRLLQYICNRDLPFHHVFVFDTAPPEVKKGVAHESAVMAHWHPKFSGYLASRKQEQSKEHCVKQFFPVAIYSLCCMCTCCNPEKKLHIAPINYHQHP